MRKRDSAMKINSFRRGLQIILQDIYKFSGRFGKQLVLFPNDAHFILQFWG